MSQKPKDKRCLNCGAVTLGKFCSDCGQTIDTNRFQMVYVFKNDFLKKVFYYDKGLFYSIKELCMRPGHSVRGYIEGKRASHIHYFSLLIILIVIFKMIENVTAFHYSDLTVTDKEQINFFEEVLKHNAKLFYISLIPLYALASFLFFKKAHLNYAEHFVLNTFRSSALLLLTILFLILATFINDITLITTINRVITLIMLMYGTWFYYQFFSPFYSSKFGVLVRSVLSVVVPFSIIVIVLALYLIYLFK